MDAVASYKSSENENMVERKKGNFHPNVWKDDFLQSLSSPYEEPLYREKVASLIEKIKEKAFNPLLADGEMRTKPYDLLQRFFLVDALQRVGIDRYFQQEIKSLLDYTYKHWKENGISWGSQNSTADLHATALGFRVLRVNEYHVSQEVFKTFCDENGHFVLRTPSEEVHNQLRSVLSLYEAAEISFPGETIMGEAKSFASQYLQQKLAQSHIINEKSQLRAEVEYFMKYSWRSRNPRWEAWNSIQIFRQDIDSWMSMEGVYRMPYEVCQNILEAAILDFNIIQAQHQIELKSVSKWWNEASVTKLDFFRHRPVEFYFAYSCGLYEFEFSLTRIGFVKLGLVITTVDDIFDGYGAIDDLIPFKTALINWDMSMVDGLPQYMKITWSCCHEIYMELANEAEKIHGQRARKWMQEHWTKLIVSVFRNSEWNAKDYLPTLDQFLKNSLNASLTPVVTLFPMILIDTVLPDDILERVSKFESDVSLATRLIDDIKDSQEDKDRGQNVSWLDCYVADNPGTTMEQALDYANATVQLHTEELNRDFFCYEKDIPKCCKRVYFDCMYRWVGFLWRDIDGFSHPSKGKDDIMKILINPIAPYS